MSTKVEKNDEDQKIEQDGVKPEDKAHKAATKIQASFRGHITRKKLKGEKKGDAPAAEAEANEKKDDAPVADGVEKKEGDGSATTDAAPATSPKADEPSKAGDAPSEEKKGEGDAVPSDEKAGSAETESAAKATTDNSPSSKAEDGPAKEEPKQADVPAAATDAADTTPAAEDAATKAAQPPTETAESSQAEEEKGEHCSKGGSWVGCTRDIKPGARPPAPSRGNCLDNCLEITKVILNSPKSTSLRENRERITWQPVLESSDNYLNWIDINSQA